MMRLQSYFWEIVILLITLVIGVTATFDDRPTYSNMTSTVVQEPFVDGRAMVYKLELDIERNCTGVFRRHVEQSGEVFHLDDRPFTWIPSDEWEDNETHSLELSFNVRVNLDDFKGLLQVGPASYHVVQVSHCNRLQQLFGHTIQEAYPPVHFNIIKQASIE